MEPELVPIPRWVDRNDRLVGRSSETHKKIINDEQYDFVPGENNKLSFRGPHRINRGTSGFTLITPLFALKSGMQNA
jgi:hypothetical protein